MSSRAASCFHLLLAAAHGVVATGLWFLALASLPVGIQGNGEPFACAARSCCCQDAAACRTSCCCAPPGAGARDERTHRARGDVLQSASCDGGAPTSGRLVRLPPCILEDRPLELAIAGIDFGPLPRMERPESCAPAPEGPVPLGDDVSRPLV